MQEEEQAAYEVREPEPLEMYSLRFPVRLIEAIKRYSRQSDIPQVKIVQRAVEAYLHKQGAL
jgi:hypothetical protein